MDIKSATFVKSSSRVGECPTSQLPEYAFIGRSNVGKSSLINSLLKKKKLAKTSSTPGKTQLINHFLINEQWYLTDLPGYGYAKVSKKERVKFSKIITQYILRRKELTTLFVLIDGRHSPMKSDLEFIRYLGEHQIPFSIVFTKKDKLKGKKINDTVLRYQEELSKTWSELPNMFITSSLTQEGREELLEYIESINTQLNA